MAITQLFKGIFRGDPPPAAAVPPSIDLTTYPSVDPGIPASSVEKLLENNRDLIERLKLSYGASRADFDKDVLSLVKLYAAYVHLLPATPDNYFNGTGGLLRMGLETGFYALQAADGQIFSGRTTISKRHVLEPRWKLATFIAGLCSEIHRTLSHVIVADEKGDEWPAFLFPLEEWLHQGARARYFVRWVPNAADMRSLGVFALPKIVPSEVLQNLGCQNTVIIPHMLASITGMPIYRTHNVLEEVIRRAAALVIDRDLRARADRYGKPQIGSHLERYLVDALRRLVCGNLTWRPNEPKSRVWYDRNGLYVVWPSSAADVCKLLAADMLPGIPKAPDTILEILIDAGVVEPKEQNNPTWMIYPPGTEIALNAIRLSSPMIVLATMEVPPEPLTLDLTVAPQPVAASTQSTPAAKRNNKDTDPAVSGKHASIDAPSNQIGLDIAADTTAPPGSSDMPGYTNPNQVAKTEEATDRRDHGPMVFELNAPMRLNPAAREAIAAAIATMNPGQDQETKACTVPDGVFVPIDALQPFKMDAALIIRALDDCGMLAKTPDGITTTVREFGTEPMCGITIRPEYVAGLDPSDFTPPLECPPC